MTVLQEILRGLGQALFYINHDLFVVTLAEEPLAGINKHELLQRLVNKETKDACSQTEELQGSGNHPLFQSLLQGLEEIVHTGLTTTSTDMWESSPPLQLHVHESESSDSSGSEELGEFAKINSQTR